MTAPTGMVESLTMVVYGPSKVGKTTLAMTAPYPRLVMDVEAGTRFASINRKYWNPLADPPPVADGTWDTCIVNTTNYNTMLKVYEWLNSGAHQFNSLIIDSISELQVKIVEQVAGRGQVALQQWGDVGRATSGLMRDMRDLTMHPTRPLKAVILTAMEREDRTTGQKVPHLTGQSAITLPYLMDVTAYLAIEEYPNEDPTQPPHRFRRMHLQPSSGRWLAGERIGGRLGAVVEAVDLNIETMISRIYGPAPVPTAIPAAATTTEEGTTS